MKITIYILYVIIFTYCYYFLNKKLPNKWIFIGYPAFFIISIIPLKWLMGNIIQIYGKNYSGELLKVILFMIAGITLFNIMYGLVNLMVNTQVGFHQNYGKPNNGHVKYVIEKATSIKKFLHFFFYTGGIILIGIAIFKAKI